MRISLRNRYLSKTRFKRYLKAVKNSSSRARRLYNANLRLAQAFHPLLSQFEVILRNSLSSELHEYFKDSNWLLNQKNGFMQHPSLSKSNFFLRRSIAKTEAKLSRKRVNITNGKLISEQSFGFWIAFFLPHHYKLISGVPIKIFKNKPLNENRASIYNKLDQIREFRNRVNHCEPICFNKNEVDCSEALHIRCLIFDLIKWIEPELLTYFESIDNTRRKVDQLNQI